MASKILKTIILLSLIAKITNIIKNNFLVEKCLNINEKQVFA